MAAKQYEVGLYLFELETGYIFFDKDGMSEGTFCGPAEAREEAKRRMKLADEDGTKDELLAKGYAMAFFTTKLPDPEENFYRIDLMVSFSYDYDVLKRIKEKDDRIIIY